jgi:uncharacterized RDD family membrane protein YckC
VSNSGWSLAIDFGTSNTTAAMRVGDGAPTVLEVENSRYLPSAVFVSETGEILTGRSAVRQGAVYPERAERVPKRALVSGAQVVLGGRAVPVTDLAGAVLGRMYRAAVQVHGGRPPSRVVLTHPVRWEQEPLTRLRQAAAAAGIEDPVLVAEPVAAAWWYARPGSDGLVGVFDLGGGTLDTAVLRATGDRFRLAGPPGGDPDLGGEDFDDQLLAWVSEQARSRDERTWTEVFAGTDTRSRRDLALLRGEVTAAKEALSEHLTYDLAVVGFAESFRLTRKDLESLVGDALDGAATRMGETIAAAGARPGQLSAVYLTGGASRTPLVGARLAVALGTLPQLRDDPKAVVALGALSIGDPSIGDPSIGGGGSPPVRGPEPGAREPGAAGDTRFIPPTAYVPPGQPGQPTPWAPAAPVPGPPAAPVPAGFYYHHSSGLVLPEGTRLASVGRRIGAYILAVLLFACTLGIGYIVWDAFGWSSGRTPTQLMLRMQTYQPATLSKPSWQRQFGREVAWLVYNIPYVGWVAGLASFVVFLVRKDHRTLHDLITETVVLHDPNLLLQGGLPSGARS